jgi:hypothetical protein
VVKFAQLGLLVIDAEIADGSKSLLSFHVSLTPKIIEIFFTDASKLLT